MYYYKQILQCLYTENISVFEEYYSLQRRPKACFFTLKFTHGFDIVKRYSCDKWDRMGEWICVTVWQFTGRISFNSPTLYKIVLI